MYLEDKRHAVLQLVAEANITISYCMHIVSFDGCGPEENELIKSLKKAVEKGKVRLL